MMPTDFVHIAMLALGGEVRGKTLLQKKIYFLGLLTDTLDDLGYRAHFYGPYSDDVATAVEELKTIGYVDQEVQSAGSWGVSGFERRRYDYKLTKAGLRIAEAKARQEPDLWSRLQNAASRLQKAGDLDYMRLSIAAKTFFMLGQQRVSATPAELAELAPRFGWRVTEPEIESAADYLDRLGLMPRSGGGHSLTQ